MLKHCVLYYMFSKTFLGELAAELLFIVANDLEVSHVLSLLLGKVETLTLQEVRMSPGDFILLTCRFVVTALNWYVAKQLKRDRNKLCLSE